VALYGELSLSHCYAWLKTFSEDHLRISLKNL